VGNNLIRLRIVGITDHTIERIHNISSESSLYDILKEVLKDQRNMLNYISEKLLDGRLLLIINGLSVYRFSDLRSITVKPGDEVAILPVVFGGCKQL